MSEHMIFLTHEDRRIKELETENTRLHLEIAQLKGELAAYKQSMDAKPWHERHVVELREDGWAIQHPLSCRPDLLNCIANTAAMTMEDLCHYPNGRYYCTVHNDELIIEEEVG